MVSPLGIGVEEFAREFFVRDPLRQRSSGSAGTAPGGKVPEFDLARFLNVDGLSLQPGSEYALGAASLALENRATQCSPQEPARCGVVSATSFCNGNGPEPSADPHSCPAGSKLISRHLALDGYSRNFSGGCLCGARALQHAWQAVASGQCDMVLAGGFDVASGDGSPEPASDGRGEAAAFLSLESESALEDAAARPLCRMASAVCLAADDPGRDSGPEHAEEISGQLCRCVEYALNSAGLWEGDIGAVFLCSGRDTCRTAREAEARALEYFTRVPLSSVKECVGETFAASFPLECAAATLVLQQGSLPGGLSLQEVCRGVEIWVEREPQRLLGDAILILGCTDRVAAAAILMAP